MRSLPARKAAAAAPSHWRPPPCRPLGCTITCAQRSHLRQLLHQQQQQQQQHAWQQQRPCSTRAVSVHASEKLSETTSSSINDINEASSTADTSAEEEDDLPSTSSQQRYSPLHMNIEQFTERIVPTAAEIEAKRRLIEAIRACTRKAFDGSRSVTVEPFGSFVSGLSTWASDVDLAVTGLAEPSRITGTFTHGDRHYVQKCLERIAGQLRRYKKLELRNMTLIRSARIPIIKLQTQNAITADVSIGDDSGPRAARYCAQQVRAYPPLRPLVLVLKVYLCNCGLNEVANGGLSSFSLTLMVLAHLMEELRSGRDIYDLGESLYAFLLRYGDEFDYGDDAVSVASGGIVRKNSLPYAVETGRWEGSNGSSGRGGYLGSEDRLCVDDPLTGRDVSAGTYRIMDVQLAFSKAARRLEALARGRRPSDTSLNYLEGLFDVSAAVRRDYGRKGRRNEYWVLQQENVGMRGPKSMDSLLEMDGDDVLSLDDFDDDYLEVEPSGEEWRQAAGGKGRRKRR